MCMYVDYQLRTATVDVLRTICTASTGELLAYAFFFATQVPLRELASMASRSK